MENRKSCVLHRSTQDEAGLATGRVSPPSVCCPGIGVGTSRRGGGLWSLLLLLALPLSIIRTVFTCLVFAIVTLPSLVPDQRGSGVVDGGELWFRILGKEEGLLAPSKGRRGLTAQGALRGSGGWVVPSMCVGVIRLSKDVGSHLVFAGGGLIIRAE